MVLVLSTFTVNVFADSVYFLNDKQLAYVYEQVKQRNTDIDVSHLNIPYSEETAGNFATTLIAQLRSYGIAGFLIDSSAGMGYSYYPTKYANISFAYVTVQEEEYVKNTVEGITEEIDEDWSELEKALYVHDYIVSHFSYDRRLYDPNEYMNVNRDIYSFLKEKNGVCQAYAETYQYIMTALGIECKTAISIEGNHEWNLVKIDGEWYHVDATHDDPIINGYQEDAIGFVNHQHFLCSSSELEEIDYANRSNAHYNWFVGDGSSIEANSDKYKTSLFREVQNAFAEANGKWYYLDLGYTAVGSYKTKLRETNDFFESDVEAVLDNTLPSVWGSLASYNDRILYQTLTSVYIYNPENKQDTLVNDFSCYFENNDMIYGMYVENDIITVLISSDMINGDDNEYYTFTIGQNGHTTSSQWEVTLPATATKPGWRVKCCLICGTVIESEEIPMIKEEEDQDTSVIKPDIDGSGKADTTDLALIKKLLADSNNSDAGKIVSADVNSDTKVDTTDLAILKKYLAGIY